MLKTAASKVAWVSPSSATGQSLRRTIIASSPASTASPRAMSQPGSLIRSTLSPTSLDPQAWGGLRKRRASWRSGSPRHRRRGPATSGSPPRGASPSRRISSANSQELEQRKAADATRELAGLSERRERLSELDRLAETVEEYLGDLPQLVRGGQTRTAKEDRAERCRWAWAYWLLGLRVVAYKDGTLEVSAPSGTASSPRGSRAR